MDRKTNDMLKIVMIMVMIAAVAGLLYLAYKTMNNNDSNLDTQIQDDVQDGMDNMENAGEEIKENIEQGTKYTIDSIENMFNGEKNIIKEEVKKMENDKYKRAQKYKIDDDEFTVYEFEDEDAINEVSMEEKFKNMIRKGNLLIDTTSEKIKTKIEELT